MKPSNRQYTGPSQFFHNYEHNPEGLTHCRGPEGNPYRIVHYEGKHIISTEYAKGHDKKRDITWFKFNERLGPGWNLNSGTILAVKDVPESGKKKIYFKIDDTQFLRSGIDHSLLPEKLANLPPIKV